VIRDYGSTFRKSTCHVDLHVQSSQSPRAEPMQPIRPGLPRRWPLHQQLGSVHNKVPHQLNATS
jgi:hypothetical protein